MREVNRANILNYESDSSDQDQDSDNYNIPLNRQHNDLQ